MQKLQKKITMPVLIDPLIATLHNIQLKIDSAVGAATALELRLRIIAELESKVREELKKKTSDSFYEANLSHIIDVVIEIFQDKLDVTEQDVIKSCRIPRNKLVHASLVEFVIKLNGEALGREYDPGTRKFKPLEEDELVEGSKCIERSRALDEFSTRANEAVRILEAKIMRSLQR